MRWRVSASGAVGLIGVVLLAAILAASLSGAVSIPLQAVPGLLWGESAPGQQLWRSVLVDIRLPRVLFAAITGAGLAVSGAAMQALFRNPLAEPGLIGISAGGALGAVAAIVLTSGSFWITAPAAFIGSLVATMCAYAVGRRVPGVAGLLLAGVAITATAFSLIGLFTFMATDTQLRDLTFWNMGSLARANWTQLGILGPWVVLIALWMVSQWRVMNALLLGEREAQHLGYALARVRAKLVLASALIIGPLVAVSGTIVFVGLVVPHLLRITIGANHRCLLPATVLGGALALVLADWAARVAVSPAELPIGLVTGLVGGPFFLWLLARGRRLS